MKKCFILLCLIIIGFTSYSQDINFKDKHLKKSILEKHPEIDLDKNGEINYLEADKVSKLNLMKLNIENVEDLNYFKNLKYLSLTDNKINEFKISGLIYLEELYIAKNNLSKIELSNFPSLKTFASGLNKLTAIIIKNCQNIESLNLMHNQINEIDIKSLKKLKYLSIENNNLAAIDISHQTKLIQITINNNHLKTLNIENNVNLKMNILYIDKDVELIGNEAQLMMYEPIKILKQN